MLVCDSILISALGAAMSAFDRQASSLRVDIGALQAQPLTPLVVATRILATLSRVHGRLLAEGISMNRLVFAAILALPSVALAHPGHSHAGMSSNHHILEAAIVAAVAVAGYFAARLLNTKLSKQKR
jgi:hypothetical protein